MIFYDKEIVLHEVKNNFEVFGYIPLTLQEDWEINIVFIAGAKKHCKTWRLEKCISIQAVKEAAQERNVDSFACCSLGLLWTYGLKNLVDENPDDLRTIDTVTGLNSFMLVASSNVTHTEMETIYQVMISCPDVFLRKRKRIS